VIAESSACRHPPADAVEDLYCAACGTLVVEDLERCGAVDGDFLCLESKGHAHEHRGVDTSKPRDVELLILSRAW
jgi:hypothetical protein